MPDSKITALASIGTGTDPAVDPLVIVDVSDTTMAASGTTKKVTLNNLLASSPTAGGNFTITGNLTVGTGAFGAGQSGGLIGNGNQLGFTNNTGNNSGWISNADNACIYSSGAGGTFAFNGHLVLQPRGSAAGAILFGTGNGAGAMAERYRIASDGVATWSNVGGVAGTAMTLNSTGLGVGVSPAYKLDVQGADNSIIAQFGGTSRKVNFTTSANGGFANGFFNFVSTSSVGAFSFQNTNGTHLTIDSAGNLGIGVTPSAWNTGKAIEFGGGSIYTDSGNNECSIAQGAYNNAGWKYKYTGVAAGLATNYGGTHAWYTAPSGTAGNAITFTERLRLKETGQLRFVPLASDPSGAEAGDVYYNSTSNKLKCYNGTTWNDLF